MKSGLSWCFSFAMVTLCVVAMIFQPLRLVNYAFKKAFVVNTLLESTVLNFHSCERSSNEVINENISMKIFLILYSLFTTVSVASQVTEETRLRLYTVCINCCPFFVH